MVVVLQEGGQLVDHLRRAGDNYLVRPGAIHRMRTLSDCDVLEVSTPEVEDVVRVQDDYGG
jgi:mannose-6-phosphate isomerase